MPQAPIFISYRRDDAAGYARAVYAELARHFGAERVFMDVDDIGAGHAFDEVIRRAVNESAVVLVMIGRRWRGEREGQLPRIFDAGDFVRMEVAAGLAGGRRVIPLLLDGAAMPGEAQLPPELHALVRRNAIEIDNPRFAADMQRLVDALREALDEPAAPPAPAQSKSTRWWMLAAPALVVALAGLWLLRSPPGSDSAVPSARPAASTTTTAPGTVRPDLNGEWRADVTYDWPNARYVERFVFGGEAGELHGSASFLRVPRGLLEGAVDPAGLRFITRTDELAGSGGSPTLHRYRGTLAGDEIRFVMQTEGGSSAHVPVEFIARRVAGAASSASR